MILGMTDEAMKNVQTIVWTTGTLNIPSERLKQVPRRTWDDFTFTQI